MTKNIQRKLLLKPFLLLELVLEAVRRDLEYEKEMKGTTDSCRVMTDAQLECPHQQNSCMEMISQVQAATPAFELLALGQSPGEGSQLEPQEAKLVIEMKLSCQDCGMDARANIQVADSVLGTFPMVKDIKRGPAFARPGWGSDA